MLKIHLMAALPIAERVIPTGEYCPAPAQMLFDFELRLLEDAVRALDAALYDEPDRSMLALRCGLLSFVTCKAAQVFPNTEDYRSVSRTVHLIVGDDEADEPAGNILGAYGYLCLPIFYDPELGERECRVVHRWGAARFVRDARRAAEASMGGSGGSWNARPAAGSR